MTTSMMRVLPRPIRNFYAIPALKIFFRKESAKQESALQIPQTTVNRKSLNWDPWLIFLLLLSIWFIPPAWIHSLDPTAVVPDQSQWLMVILSLITFLLIMALCWWLLNRQWRLIGLPPISQLVLNFKLFTLCQQLGFYFLSFALVLLAALACLIAIC